ncbi:MAG: thermonuclease family protein [Hormoscilla sp. SP5CHS1]|nr:thermonuclease family protein [Hormoscilla sp. SP12CHS1]MBC6452981.1 thermonuclease family protein [Hormoscilla sp. SP5CHS1]
MKTNLPKTIIGPMLCCLLLLASCFGSATPQGQMVLVKQVVSGQTIEVVSASTPTADPRRVRLIGIEAPDMRQQPWGIEARRQLAQLLGDRSVLLELDVEKRDQYQRQLSYIWARSADGPKNRDSLLNEEMVKRGYALAKPRSPNTKYDQRLANAQAWARIMGVGIWNPEQPMGITPTEFRSQNRSSVVSGQWSVVNAQSSKPQLTTNN